VEITAVVGTGYHCVCAMASPNSDEAVGMETHALHDFLRWHHGTICKEVAKETCNITQMICFVMMSCVLIT